MYERCLAFILNCLTLREPIFEERSESTYEATVKNKGEGCLIVMYKDYDILYMWPNEICMFEYLPKEDDWYITKI